MKWVTTIAVVATLGAANMAWADNHQGKSDRNDHHGMMPDTRQGDTRRGMMQGDMMRGGMMSMMMNMMQGNMAGMADECAGMMRDMESGSTKPNEQWRKDR
jgi:hypothetical protein